MFLSYFTVYPILIGGYYPSVFFSNFPTILLFHQNLSGLQVLNFCMTFCTHIAAFNQNLSNLQVLIFFLTFCSHIVVFSLKFLHLLSFFNFFDFFCSHCCKFIKIHPVCAFLEFCIDFALTLLCFQ